MILGRRHHPFHARFNWAMLAACRCNHDVSVLVRAPHDAEQKNWQQLMDEMACSARAASFYISKYLTKPQPQLASLWALLRDGQARLERELSQQTEQPAASYRARRTLLRLLDTCQRQAHRSMPEICQYLLGYPEAYTNATFRPLYTTSALRRAELLVPTSESALPNPPETAFWLRPRTVNVDAPLDGAADAPDAQPAVAEALALTTGHQELDYMHRGADLRAWPFYFYVAGVRRVARTQAARQVAFACTHPQHLTHVQAPALQSAWQVPQLTGPAFPLAGTNPERRACSSCSCSSPGVLQTAATCCTPLSAATFAKRGRRPWMTTTNISCAIKARTLAGQHHSPLHTGVTAA